MSFINKLMKLFKNMSNNRKGKFIVIYGINNLGKTTQVQKLVTKLKQEDEKVEYLKYPIYELEPSGKMINNYLREDNRYGLSARDVQIIYAFNRTQYEPYLLEKLESGISVVSEDYTGTGLAWGITTGVDEEFLKYINKHLLKEDIAFLFDGKRFTEAEESSHRHEANKDFMETAREVHLRLGQELSWEKINANRPEEEVHEEIWRRVKGVIGN